MRFQRIIVIGMALGLAVALGGCASTSDSESTSTSESTPKSQPTSAAKPASVAPGSALAKVEIGMSDAEVRTLLGEPGNIRSYPTGKNWIPFYFGGDTYRFDWIYSGKGRVIFGNTSRFSRAIKVVELLDNPDEP